MSEWLISRGGSQEGPFSAKQVGEMLAGGELRASEAFAWKEGMTEWKPLPESGVLAEASMSQVQPSSVETPGPAAASSRFNFGQPAPQAAAVVNPYSTPASAVAVSSGFEQPLLYPGIGRLAYFGLQFAITIFAYAILFFVILGAGAAESLQGAFGGFIVVVLLASVAGFYIAVKRVRNLGMSGWAVLWSFVPIMSIWISWRMFACPPGYDSHKQLDTAGKVLTGIMIGLIVLAVVANIIVAASGGGNY